MIQSANDKNAYRTVTIPGNKMEALLISDISTEKASACVAVNVGSMSDPKEAPGLAHFLEHMLFLGTEKFPVENAYSAFLNEHGGHSNAYTSQKETVYYFDVQKEHLNEALDMFASFFSCPLFLDTCTDREMNAVDSENSKNLQNDTWRLFQLLKSKCDQSHPFSNFSTGNLETLSLKPKEGEEDKHVTRELMLKFYKEHYSANLMKLVVYGKESLDELEKMVMEKFKDVPNKDLEPKVFPPKPLKETAKLLEVVPIKDLKRLSMVFPTTSHYDLYLSKPNSYISHLIGHESAGSILSALKSKQWANGLSAYTSPNEKEFAFFTVNIDLTEEGVSHVLEIVACVFTYIGMLVREGPQDWVWEETKNTYDMSFRFLEKEEPSDITVTLANAMHRYAPEHVLSGDYLIVEKDLPRSMSTLDELTPQNCLVSVIHKGAQGKADKKEQWYGTEHSERPFLQAELDLWGQAKEGAGSAYEEWGALLHLPAPNVFIPTDFTLKSSLAGVEQSKEVKQEEEKPKALFPDLIGLEMVAAEEINVEAAVEEEEGDGTENKGSSAPDPESSAESEGETAGGEGEAEAEAAGAEEEGEEEGEEVEVAGGAGGQSIGMPILNGERLVLWHLQDHKWLVPKVNVNVILSSLYAGCTPLNAALVNVFSMILKEELNEYSYFADCAGLTYDIALAKNGLELTFQGYHHKMPVLVERVFQTLRTLAVEKTALAPALFARMKEKALRSYANTSFSQPYYHCIVGSLMCMEDPRWSHVEKHAALVDADIHDLQSFASRFIKHLKAEVLVHGNVTAEEAKTLAALTDAVGHSALPVSQEGVRRMVALPANREFVFRQHCRTFNPNEVNSAVETVYMVGEVMGAGEATPSGGDTIAFTPRLYPPLDGTKGRGFFLWDSPSTSSIALEAITVLMGHLLSEPAFDQLRTKEQLGYIVFAGVKKLGQHNALHIIVQSNHRDPKYLDDRVESFLKQFRNDLLEFTAEQVAANVQAVIDLMTEKPKNLNEECKKMWSEICDNYYLFDRRHRCAAALRAMEVDVALLVSFFDRYLREEGNPERRKLSSQFYGKAGDYKTKKGVEVFTDTDEMKRNLPLLPVRKFTRK